MLALAQRKAFALRAAIAVATRETKADPGDSYLLGLDVHTSEIARKSIQAEPTQELEFLDRFLSVRGQQALQANEALFEASKHLVLRRAIETRLGIVCATCPVTAIAGSPCRGGSNEVREWELVWNHDGQCLREISSTWQLALKIAKELYDRAIPGLPDVNVTFSLQFDPGELNRSIPGYELSYHAEVEKEGVGPEFMSSVKMRLSAGKYGTVCAAAVFHVLLHEALCHVWQGAAGAAPRRFGAGTDPLAEGWMDFLASELTSKWIGHTDAASRTIGTRDAQASRGLHHARASLDNPKDCFAQASYVNRGASAALSVLKYLTLDSGGDAWEDFVDLSIRLNAYPWRAVARDDACRLLDEKALDFSWLWWNDLDDALKKARREAQVEDLVQALSSLQRHL